MRYGVAMKIIIPFPAVQRGMAHDDAIREFVIQSATIGFILRDENFETVRVDYYKGEGVYGASLDFEDRDLDDLPGLRAVFGKAGFAVLTEDEAVSA